VGTALDEEVRDITDEAKKKEVVNGLRTRRRWNEYDKQSCRCKKP